MSFLRSRSQKRALLRVVLWFSRTRLNQNVDRADTFLVKLFYNLDHNTYLEGSLPREVPKN